MFLQNKKCLLNALAYNETRWLQMKSKSILFSPYHSFMLREDSRTSNKAKSQ